MNGALLPAPTELSTMAGRCFPETIMSPLTDLIGYIAAFCTTFAFVPQAYSVWKTRSTRDLSLAMFLVFTIGVCLWLVYGCLIGSWPIIIANLCTVLLAGYILAMKITEGRRRPD